jgi:hypothetical protein
MRQDGDHLIDAIQTCPMRQRRLVMHVEEPHCNDTFFDLDPFPFDKKPLAP